MARLTWFVVLIVGIVMSATARSFDRTSVRVGTLPFVWNEEGLRFVSSGPWGGVEAGTDGTVRFRVGGAEFVEEYGGTGLPLVTGEQVSGTRVFRVRGPDSSARGIPAFRSVALRGVEPRVDVVLTVRDSGVERRFWFGPGSDPGAFGVWVRGAVALTVDKDGRLEVETTGGTAVFSAPVAWQEVEGRRVPVAVSYRVEGDAWGFVVGPHDPSLPLVVDPLLASTYLGGSGDEWWDIGLALGPDQDLYVATTSSSPDFPVTPGAFAAQAASDEDVVVARLSRDMSQVLAATYLGGAGWDYAQAVAVDPKDHSVLVTGKTTDPASFPSTEAPCDGEAFVVRLSGDLSSLLASSCLPVWSGGEGTAIAVDEEGRVFVAGTAGAGSIATPGAYDTSKGLYTDAFVARLGPDLSLQAGTWLGGEGDDGAEALRIGPDHTVWVAGTTRSDWFPTTAGAFQEAHGGSYENAFIAHLDADLTTLLASTFLGSDTYGYALDLDPDGNPVVAGATTDPDFPTTEGAFDRTYGYGGWKRDGFVSRLDASLSSLLASTYLGGSDDDWVEALVVDQRGTVFVAGKTFSFNFPFTFGAFASGRGGYIARFSPGLDALMASTAVGGVVEFTSLLLGPDGEVYAGGSTQGDKTFPVGPDSFQKAPSGVSDVVLTSLDPTLSAALSDKAVSLAGPTRVAPGDDLTVLVEWQNVTGQTLEDAVLSLTLPEQVEHAGCSSGCIHRLDQHEVFWWLGDLGPGDAGSVVFKGQVPWGTPLSSGRFIASLGAENVSSGLDVSEYLSYPAVDPLSQRSLSQEEAAAALAGDSSLAAALAHAEVLGYRATGPFREVVAPSGETFTVITLIRPDGPAFLVSGGGATFGLAFVGEAWRLFTPDGGLEVDEAAGTWKPWGSWAESHSPSVAACVFNVVVDTLLGATVGLLGDSVQKAMDTIQCVACLGSGMTWKESCEGCALAVVSAGPVGTVLQASKGLKGCLEDSSSSVCEKDRRVCDRGWFTGIAQVRVNRCDRATGRYLYTEIEYCAYGDVCRGGHCVDPDTLCNGALLTECPETRIEVSPAHDPNEKRVDVEGAVLPGERLTYTIHYENTGEGTARGVFVMDRLGESLDEATLDVADGGMFHAASRLLLWDVGDLPAGGQGSVGFSAMPRSDLVIGTEVSNAAEVHFPSAMEVTPTNPVVNVVATVAAEPGRVETVSGVPVAVTLCGRAASGKPLTFAVTTPPSHGGLSGIAPDLSYVSAVGYSGPDWFGFTVSDGTETSAEAGVFIVVHPDPADSTPPEVAWTWPPDGATDVVAPAGPVAASEYRPLIRVAFSEPVDHVDAATFTVTGLDGAVRYDESLRVATFVPSSPLAPDTEYEAVVSTGVVDRAGNALASDHVWRFTTASAVNAAIILPDEATALDFGALDVQEVSDPEVVVVASTGTEPLEVTEVAVEGEHPLDFAITEDSCTGALVQPQAHCTFRVAFAPLSVGPKSAAVAVTTSDPDTPVVQVPVSGMGKASPIPEPAPELAADPAPDPVSEEPPVEPEPPFDLGSEPVHDLGSQPLPETGPGPRDVPVSDEGPPPDPGSRSAGKGGGGCVAGPVGGPIPLALLLGLCLRRRRRRP